MWISATGTSGWTYTSALLNTELTKPERDGKSFRLLVRAVDIAGNIQRTFTVGTSSLTFRMDTTKPTTTVSKPVANRSYRPADISGGSAFTGLSEDGPTVGASGMYGSEVVLSYLNPADNATYYWTGTAFSSLVTESASWLPATAVNTYTSSMTWRYLFANASDWSNQGDQNSR